MQLEGIRVVDLTRIVAGPFCSMFLADMGAEVVKVETPGEGDPVRKQGAARNGYSLYFATFNRNKRSITLDLRTDEAKEVAPPAARPGGRRGQQLPPGRDGQDGLRARSAAGDQAGSS